MILIDTSKISSRNSSWPSKFAKLRVFFSLCDGGRRRRWSWKTIIMFSCWAWVWFSIYVGLCKSVVHFWVAEWVFHYLCNTRYPLSAICHRHRITARVWAKCGNIPLSLRQLPSNLCLIRPAGNYQILHSTCFFFLSFLSQWFLLYLGAIGMERVWLGDHDQKRRRRRVWHHLGSR